MFKKFLSNAIFGTLLFLLGAASPVAALEETSFLAGSFTHLGQSVNFEASAPTAGGSLSGNFSGPCTGAVNGTWNATTNTINGVIEGQCNVLGFDKSFYLNYSGSIDTSNETLTVNSVTRVDGSDSLAATFIGLPATVDINISNTPCINGGDCYNTIQEAVDGATAGNSINVRGSFTETVNVTKALTLNGTNSTTVTRFINWVSGVLINGITAIVDNATPTTPNLTNLINNSNKDNITISGNALANMNLSYTFSDSLSQTIVGTGAIAADGTYNISGINLTSLEDGTITLTITVNDGQGHVSQPVSTTTTKDTVLPVATSSSVTTSNSNPGYAKVGDLITLSFSTSEAIQNPSVSIFGHTVTGSNISGNNWVAIYQMILADIEGFVSAQFSFQDLFGNTSNNFVNVPNILFDKTAPSLPTITTNTINLANITNVTLTGTGEADATINYSISDGTNTITGNSIVASDGTINITGINISSLNDGAILISLTLTDAAGNISVNGLYPATKDTTASNTSDNVDTNWHNGNVTITLTCTDVVSGCQKIVYTTDGSDPLSSATAIIVLGSVANIILSNEGTYTIKYYSNDLYGNQEIVKTALNQVQIDLTSPTSNAGGDQTKNGQFIQTGIATDTLSGVATVAWSKVTGPGLVVFGSDNNLVTTISADVDGNYVISLTVTDNAGNVATSTFNLVWDTIAPTTIDNTDNLWHVTPVTIILTCTDNLTGCANTYYTIDGSTPTIASSTGNSIVISTDGIYTIKYFSVDSAGNIGSFLTALNQVLVDQTAGTAIWINPVAGSARNRTINLAFTSADNLSGVLSTATFYKLNDGIDTFHSLPSSWDTASLTLGNYTLRIIVTDVAGNIANIDEVIDIIAIITNFRAEANGTDKVIITFDTNHPTRARVRWVGGASGEDESFVTHHVMTINGLSAFTTYLFEALARIPTGPYSISDEKAGAKTFSKAGAPVETSSSNNITVTPLVAKPEVTKQAAETSIFDVSTAFAAEEDIPAVEGESIEPSIKPETKNSNVPLVNLIQNILKVFGNLFQFLLGIFN